MTAIATRAEVDANRTLRLAVPCDLPSGPVNVVVQVAPADDGDAIPPDLAEAVAALKLMGDDDLWRAARSRLCAGDAERLEAIHFRTQRGVATDAELAEVKALERQYEWALLNRAEAMGQLLARGQDVSGLLAP